MQMNYYGGSSCQKNNFILLQVNDALFPIGGYSHSQGLETYIQRGIVHDVDTAREYITHKIKWNLAYTELLAARLAYEAAEKKDLKELLYLEELLEASRIPMEQREAARKMGSRFAKTIEKLGLSISENRDFQRISGCTKRKSSKSLLYLRSFLRRNADSAGESLNALSLCTDLSYCDKLCKNNSIESDIRAAAAKWLLWRI